MAVVGTTTTNRRRQFGYRPSNWERKRFVAYIWLWRRKSWGVRVGTRLTDGSLSNPQLIEVYTPKFALRLGLEGCQTIIATKEQIDAFLAT